MKQKIVVFILAIAVACAGTLPLANPAHAANNDPNNIIATNLTPLASQMIINIPKAESILVPQFITKVSGSIVNIPKSTPGTALPSLASKLGPKIGASLIPSGTATFLFDKLSGPLASIGLGMLMNATGLNKLLHMGSEDAEALAEIRQQLEVISAQLADIKEHLGSQDLQIAQSDLTRDVNAIDTYNDTIKTFYTRYFEPMWTASEAVIKAQGDDKDQPVPQKLQDDLNEARYQFYKAYDARPALEEIANQVHKFLVPRNNAKSVLQELGDVILKEKRYLSAADSARIRQLYYAAAATESMAAWMEMERNTPTESKVMNTDADPPVEYKPAPSQARYNVASTEFRANTVQEFLNLPPAIPQDVVIDAGPSPRTSTNNTTMYMPASARPDLFARPGVAGSVQPAVDVLNASFGSGFNNWAVPSQAGVTALLGGYKTTETVGQYLSGLNPQSSAWQAITELSWPFVWSNTVTNPFNKCSLTGGGLGNVNRYSGVWTGFKSVSWAPRPPIDSDFMFQDPSHLCASYVDTEWKTRAQGGVIATRPTGVMPIDYMAQGAGPNVAKGAVLRHADLSGFNLSGVDLTGADLRGSNLNGTTLANAELAGANLVGAGTNLIFGIPKSLPSGWNLITHPTDKERPGALIGPGANLFGANLSGMDLSGVNLGAVTSGGTDCTGCKLPPGWHWTGMPQGLLVGPGADLSNRNLTGLDFHGLDLSSVNFADSNLTDTNLTGARITGVNVSNATFTSGTLVAGLRSDFLFGQPASMPTGWRVRNGYFAAPAVELPAADLSAADLTSVDLTGANMVGANLTGANLSNATLTNARMASTNLTNTNLTNAILKNLDIFRATITGATLLTNDDNKLSGITSGRLVGQPRSLPASGRFRVAEGYLVGPSTNLEGAQFTSLAQLGVSLSGTNFTGAFVAGVNFTNATLTNAIFTGATLLAANLSGANMTNAQLFAVRSGSIFGTPSLPPEWKLIKGYLVGPGANLRGAALGGANFTGANLSGADLSLADVANAIWSNTTCPNGTVQSTPCPIGFGANGPTSVTAEANELGTGVRVNVQPDLGAAEWAFTIEKLSESGGWIRVGSLYRTRGGNDTLTINLDEGTYRAVVPSQRNYFNSMSAVVVLKK